MYRIITNQGREIRRGSFETLESILDAARHMGALLQVWTARGWEEYCVESDG